MVGCHRRKPVEDRVQRRFGLGLMGCERQVVPLEDGQYVVHPREQDHVRIEIQHGPAARQLQQMFQRERLDRRGQLHDAVREAPGLPVRDVERFDAEMARLGS